MCKTFKYPLISDFIEAVKKELPDNLPVASYLIEILPIGREAVYRRVRGEIPFTMPEVAIIAHNLNLSLDNLINNFNTNKVSFDLNLIDDSSPIDNYIKLLEGQLSLFRKLKSHNNIVLKAAFNSIPYSFFLDYELIAKFQLYKYVFHVKNVRTLGLFSDFEVSGEVKRMQAKCRDTIRNLCDTQYILDKRLFVYFAEDVSQFHRMKMINDTERDQIRGEVLSLLRDLEDIAISGLSKMSGRSVDLFLSHIHFDSSYIFYESDEYEVAHFRLFTINGIRSDNSRICDKQKRWLESLRQNSTRISLSNAIFRKKYFKAQRDAINKILE